MTTALPRITARVDIATQELLSQASAIAGMSSINSFVLSAAIEKARTIIEREQSLKLSQRDAIILVDAIDAAGKLGGIDGTPTIVYMNRPTLSRLLFGSETDSQTVESFAIYFEDNPFGKITA